MGVQLQASPVYTTNKLKSVKLRQGDESRRQEQRLIGRLINKSIIKVNQMLQFSHFKSGKNKTKKPQNDNRISDVMSLCGNCG